MGKYISPSLVNAAQDLLEAARAACSVLSAYDVAGLPPLDPREQEAYDKLKTAIAKAEGKP